MSNTKHTASEWLAGYDEEWEEWNVYALINKDMSFPSYFQSIAKCGDNDISEANAHRIVEAINTAEAKDKQIAFLEEELEGVEAKLDIAVKALELVKQHYKTAHWITNKHEAQSKRGMIRKVENTLKQIKGEQDGE